MCVKGWQIIIFSPIKFGYFLWEQPVSNSNSSSSSSSNTSSRVDDTHTPAQRQAAARLALRKQLEKTLLRVRLLVCEVLVADLKCYVALEYSLHELLYRTPKSLAVLSFLLIFHCYVLCYLHKLMVSFQNFFHPLQLLP